MAGFIADFVICSESLAIALRRNDRGFSHDRQQVDPPLVRVVRFVGGYARKGENTDPDAGFRPSLHCRWAPAGEAYIVTDTAFDIESLTAAEITAAKAIGLQRIVATDVLVVFTVAQAEALTDPEFNRIEEHAVTVTDTSLVLSVAQAIRFTSRMVVTPASGGTFSIFDTAANIGTPDGGTIGNLRYFIDLSAIQASDTSVALTVALAIALDPPLPVSVPAGQQVTLADTAADIEGMSATEMGALPSIGVTAIRVIDTSLTLTVAQALALLDPIPLSVPAGQTISILDSETNIDGMTPAQIAALPSIGVTALDVSSLTGAAPVIIDGGIILAVDGAVSTSQTIAFAGSGGVLDLASPLGMGGRIAGFSSQDTIDLAGAPYDIGASASLDANNLLSVVENSGSYSLQFDPAQYFLSESFVRGANAGGGTAITLMQLPMTSSFTVPYGLSVDGATIGNGGTLDVSYGGTVNDVIIDANGALVWLPGASIGGTVTFGSPGGMVQILDTTMPGIAIGGMAAGYTIDLAEIAYDAGSSAQLSTGNQLQVMQNSQTYDLQLDPMRVFAGDYFHTTLDSSGGVAIIEDNAPCYASGTRIRTMRGDIAVEELRPGNHVASAFGGWVRVTWLGHRRVDCRRHPRPHEVWPVRVAADAFAPGLPSRDLFLSPDHAVFVDGVLIPIRHLVNDATITQQPMDDVTYWHVELPMHDVIFAEGLAAESYLDTGNRQEAQRQTARAACGRALRDAG